MKLKTFICIFFLLFPLTVFGKKSTVQQKMLRDLEMIASTFEVKYAPADWKRAYNDWDLDRELEKARHAILKNPSLSIKEYQQILRQFFNAPFDYHVGVYFYATELAALPFRVESIEGRYFIRWVDSKFSRQKPDVLKVGDEIWLFDGEPVDAIVKRIKVDNFGDRVSTTDQALAEQYLTFRLASIGHEVPTGSVNLQTLRDGKVLNHSLDWEYIPEKIVQAPNKWPDRSFVETEKKLGDMPYFQRNMSSPIYDHLHEGWKQAFAKREFSEEEVHAELLGDRKGFLPDLGKVIWQSRAYCFHAYLYESKEGKRVGYVRIPHYRGDTLYQIEELAEILSYLEKNSEALVVDQLNNPGGYAFYMYAIASMLTNYPLIPPMECEALTHENVAFALTNINILEGVRTDEEARQVIGPLQGYPVNYEVALSFKRHFYFMIDEWNKGHTLTNPTFLLDRIYPHPKVHYSKPILILVNHLDISCGDYFPAIMQDNKRAAVFGSKTAGAGGALMQVAYPNYFGVATYSLTSSIAERANRDPIENLGVTPDIAYDVTLDDLVGGFKGYVEAVNNAVSDLISN